MRLEISETTQATVRKIEFQNMEGTLFSQTMLADAEFDDVDLSRVSIHNVNLSGAKITDANLSGATFNDINLKDVCITDANIEGLTINGFNIAVLIADANRPGQ